MPRCIPSGPRNATIAIVGEAPGAVEERVGTPFVGPSGEELDRMLHDAGIERHACFLTNLCMDRPAGNDITEWLLTTKKGPADYVQFRGRLVAPHIPSEWHRLVAELKEVNPRVVIALGNSSMWALCKEVGVSKWRGSLLESDAIPGLKVIPALHPAAILRDWASRYITVQDFRRAKQEQLTHIITRPIYNFKTGPSYEETVAYLVDLLSKLTIAPQRLVVDLEIFRKEILCVGIGTSTRDAFCIPFLCLKGYYFDEHQHTHIVMLLRQVLLHPQACICNQNLSFDIQYLFWRFFIKPRAFFDTMIAQGVLFPGTPKSLDYLASIYNEHYLYWKDDGKFWISYESDEKIWHYNCLDCVNTFEVMEGQEKALDQLGLREQFNFVQHETFPALLDMMIKGVKVDLEAKAAISRELWNLDRSLKKEIEYLANKDMTGKKGDLSSTQLIKFFYQELGLPTILSREKRPTCDDEALKKIANRNPWLRPLTGRINMLRSYGTAIDAVSSKTDDDGRWRTSYNAVGTETLRLSSSKNIFDSGLNLQNLTSGKDILDD